MNEVQVLKVTPPQSKPCSNNAFVALAESLDSEFETSDNEAKKKHKSKTEAKEVCQSQKAMKLAPIFTKTPSKSNEKCTGTSVVDKDMTMTNASTVTPAGNSTPPRFPDSNPKGYCQIHYKLQDIKESAIQATSNG